jgi:23S rRNA maturation mini-RNase III
MSNLRIKGLLEELNKLQREVPSEITAKAEANIQHELDEWILREEMLWKQRSREL